MAEAEESGVGAAGAGTGRWRFGIRARMLLVTLAVGLPFLFYLVFSTAQQAAVEQAHAGSRLRLIAGLTAARLDDRVNDVRQTLKAINGSLAGRLDDRTRNDLLLQRLRAEVPPDVTAITLWSLAGERVGGTEAGESRNAAGRYFFQQALAENGFVVEAPVRDAVGRWTAVFAQPLTFNGKVIGVASAESTLPTQSGLLDPARETPEGAVIAVQDIGGQLVARSVDAEQWIGKTPQMEPELRRRRANEASGTMEIVGIDGVRRIYGYARARSAPWLVNVGLPVDVALAPVRTGVRDSLLKGGGLLLLGLVVAAVFAGQLARPARQLCLDAEALAAGDLSHRSRVAAGGELGVLGDTLNRMATALQERQQALTQSEARLALALEGSGQGLFDWDLRTNRMYLSPHCSVMRGGPSVEMDTPPEALEPLVHPDDLAGLRLRVKDTLSGRTPALNAEFRVRTERGGAGPGSASSGWIWIRRRGRVVERGADGRALRLAGTVADITTRKKTEDELRQRAEIDSLTGLPNRALYNERVRRAMARGQRYNRPMALLFLDIDHFKQVNDTLGHEAGDALLRAVARRMSESVRTSDTVARLAGDEFVVILEQLGSIDDAIAVAQKLVDSIRIPVAIGRGQRVQTSISVGVAMALPGEADAAAWLHRADEALYEAKRRGRDRYALYNRAGATTAS